MIKIALGLLKSYWKEVLVAILVATLLGVIHFKNNKLDTQNTTILQLQEDLAVTKSQLSECRGHIDGQNIKIIEAAENSKKNIESMNELGKSIDAIKKDQKLVIDNLRNQPAPVTCKEATDYLGEHLEELGKW